MKVCSTCGAEKILDDFYKQKDGRHGRHASCKDCRSTREKKLYTYEKNRKKVLRRYGITPSDYDRLFTAQGGKCAICKAETEKLVVDHNHNTGRVRGLLCQNCNRGIGLLKESIVVMLSAIDYIEYNG